MNVAVSDANIPGGSVGQSHVQGKKCSTLAFDPRLGRSPWGRLATILVFLPGESHGQRSLVDYSPYG